MEKSKNLICKSLRLIFMAIIIISFLEFDVFAFLRRFVASCIPFFQGKRVLISNIFIGILGSAILTCFSEVIAYNQTKKEMQMKILNLYDKLEKEIRYESSLLFNNIQSIDFFSEKIYPFSEEVYSVYNSYVPFFRAGGYVKLIRTMYEYTKEFKEYIDRKSNLQNEEKYVEKSIHEIKAIKKEHNENDEIRQNLDNLQDSYEQHLKELSKQRLINDESEFISSINRKKAEIEKLIGIAFALRLRDSSNSIEKQDRENDMIKIKKSMRKIKYSLIIYDIKNFIHNIRTKLFIRKNNLKKKNK